jgi:hypothetical protein
MTPMVPLVGVPETIRRGLAPYREVFCRAEGFEHISRYVTGLILSPNKTLQGIYDLQVWEPGVSHSRRAMHEAVFEAGWAADALLGVAVQFVRKPTISSVRKINRLATTLVRFFNGINGFLRCRSIPCCCVRHPIRTGGGRENEPAAVLCHWKLHHPAEVDPRKVHGCNVAQHVCLDTPRSCVVPGVQDPLDAVGHPRHNDVGQQREGTGDGHQFLLTPAPCRGNTPEVDHPLQGMNGLAVVENP